METGSIHLAADGLVMNDPGVLGGKPVSKGTRLPVQALFDYLADGLSLDNFVETFPSVTRDEAAAVLRYVLRQIEAELELHFEKINAAVVRSTPGAYLILENP